MAEPGGYIRLFVDEGGLMDQLLLEAASRGIDRTISPGCWQPSRGNQRRNDRTNSVPAPSSLIEPLSQRELEVLQLICQGLSNHEICKQLYLALDTVKGHNRRIFEKLQVHRRTEAIARAREFGLF